MTSRGADYRRIAQDDYPTPPNVTKDLLRFMHKDLGMHLCDPCPGRGHAMEKVFKPVGYRPVRGPKDFLTGQFSKTALGTEFDLVVNPPYGDRRCSLAVKFIERALEVIAPWRGKAVFLLPFDFDAAKGRRHLFMRKEFAGKIVLPYRIAWFNNTPGSVIHAWYYFNYRHKGSPTIKYMSLDNGWIKP